MILSTITNEDIVQLKEWAAAASQGSNYRAAGRAKATLTLIERLDRAEQLAQAKAVALFPHVLAGMAVVLGVSIDELKGWLESRPEQNLPEAADETAGGFPVAAAPVKAEQLGEPAATREATPGTSSVSSDVTGGESAATKSQAKAGVDAEAGHAMSELVAVAAGPADVELASRVDGGRTPSASAGAEANAEAPAPKQSTAHKIKAIQVEHPDWTARQIADEIGADQKHINAAAKRAGITIHRLSADEVIARRRQGGAMGGVARPTPPEASAVPGTLGSDEVHRPIVRPKGQRYRLRTGNGTGKYLHMSCVGLVPGAAYAWSGTEAQLQAVRQKFPETLDMREEAIEK